MKFTQGQISEIISGITNGESGLQGLVKQGLESLMISERSLHNTEHEDVSNGYRERRVCHGGKVFELRVPRSRNSNFYPMLLGVLKDQEEEARKLVSSLYCSGLTTEQVGKIYEQFYGKHYSKSQVSRLINTAREDVNVWLRRKLETRYPILYIDATYVLTRRDECVSNEACYTVLGVKEDRIREVLTVVNFPTESATNFRYEREIRGMIYTTNWIERLNRDYKRVINMRGAMPNPKIVSLKVCKSQFDYFCNANIKNESQWNLHRSKFRK